MPMVKHTADRSSANKLLMYCEHCDFTCTFASQMIQHRKNHSNEIKNVLNINVHLANNDKPSPTLHNKIREKAEAKASNQQSDFKKEITLKKINFNSSNQVKLNETASSTAYDLKSCTPSSAKFIVKKIIPIIAKQNETVLNNVHKTLLIHGDKKTHNDSTAIEKLPSLKSASACDQCDFVAKNKSDLAAHKLEHEVLYSCSECEYTTQRRKHFERHEWCHAVDYPFKCEYCSFSSNTEIAVKRHVASFHISLKNKKNIQKRTDNIESVVPVKILKVDTNSVSTNLSKLHDEVVIECKEVDGSTRWHCHICNMDFDDRQSVINHTKLMHNKFFKDCVIIGKMKSTSLNDSQLSSSSDNSNSISDKNHSMHKIKTIVMNKSEKDQSSSNICKNVFKCAHCVYVTDHFDKLKHHLEHESNNPNHAAKTTIKINTEDYVVEKPQSFISPKMLENDVYKNDLKKISPDNMKKNLYSDDEVSLIDNLSSEMNSPLEYGEVDDKLLPLVDKLKVKCLLCRYMTYSAKCLKKHLLKEHASIVINKKLLQEFTRKCFLHSLEIASKKSKNKIQTHDKPSLSNSENSMDESASHDKTTEDLMLQMSVQSETIKISPIKEAIFKNNNISSTRPNVFKCSVCSRTSNFKCNIKKHIEAVHPNATMIHYKNKMGPDGNKLILVSDEKLATKELEKLPLLQNEPISTVKIETDEAAPKSIKTNQGSEVKVTKIGMADDLRIKRFKCSVCPYRSNFRNNIGSHVNMRHKNFAGAHFYVMSVEEAKETLPFYNYKRYDFELYSNNEGGSSRKQNGLVKESVPKEDSCDIDETNFVVALKDFYEDELKRCRICPFTTKKSEILKLHMNYHQPQKRNLLSCPYCPFYVNTTRLMRHHLALHEGSTNNRTANGNQISSSNNIGSLTSGNSNYFASNVVTAADGSLDQNGLKNVFNWNIFINNVKFCRAKYICELCPFTSDERGDYWYHRKCHIYRDDRANHFKCEKCLYWAEDKKDFTQHTLLHDLISYSPKVKLNQSDLSIGEFCRCDLANFLNFSDLACFKQLVCNYCSYKCSSVQLMRQHAVTHVAFSDASNTRLFMSDLDDADEVIGNLCSRLLNMNYSLAEESFDANKQPQPPNNMSKLSIDCDHVDGVSQKVDAPHYNADDNENMEMPVLEKISDLEPGIYDPHELPLHLSASSPCCSPLIDQMEEVVSLDIIQQTSSEVSVKIIDDDDIEQDMRMNELSIEKSQAAGGSEQWFTTSNVCAISDGYDWMMEDWSNDDTKVLLAPEEIVKCESDDEVANDSMISEMDNEDNDDGIAKSRTPCDFAKMIFMNSLELLSSTLS